MRIVNIDEQVLGRLQLLQETILRAMRRIAAVLNRERHQPMRAADLAAMSWHVREDIVGRRHFR